MTKYVHTYEDETVVFYFFLLFLLLLQTFYFVKFYVIFSCAIQFIGKFL